MTSRRSLFKLALCAVAASAVEVMGWEGVRPRVHPRDCPCLECQAVFWGRNFAANVCDIWEERHREQYEALLSGHRIIFESPLIFENEIGPKTPEKPILRGLFGSAVLTLPGPKSLS